MEVSGQLHALASLSLGRETSLDRRLEAWWWKEKNPFLVPGRNQIPVVQLIA
jgi:hypothetical protein